MSEKAIQKILVTGGAGFIGSHLVDRLLSEGYEVTVFDNLSSGNKKYIEPHLDKPNFTFLEADLLDEPAINKACCGIDMVYHAAANPDVRLGVENTKVHFDQNIRATYNLLEAMRKNEVPNLAFTSTSTVYGEATVIPTPEDYGPLVPISLYGASKLACEALITSYSHTFDMNCWIFRFANIIGSRSNHGIIFDFINKLRANPKSLEILGDGKQSKSYLHVPECVKAILFAVEHSRNTVNIFNIGSEDTLSATEIGEVVAEEMGLQDVEFTYTGGSRGWKGDVPKMRLDVAKLREIGWNARCTSQESVRNAVRELL
ncbi:MULTISPECIES: NAD-dependent epimerase/dehydratase family protein [Methanohalophilus]|jgi:UDP-glucose 4-epimerase|uniref:SDR family NAD(P)-dependent oxidoreductase n=1 Tax=Methanohalophilus euhalobius TaxID=51203 RepID=A0A285F6P0_9EURY|nr:MULTISPECIES: NAD-dependent epimerase/dehydratase family protein [Methanohalophilus]KXS46288.1 MAG: UDP-glucose 4-epimerase [Methanohalophilus sp. T328-1]RSD35067.1 MAG: UDP-glucose 4-epimerase [Methanohalophilus sp.]OBZ34289.1 MAG: UDP-glucose 4-epimerase [Methanohalophilus sp. DAL1]ODV50004.1 MAG: UDP-glucose 4-epimerase [Methanohalophilus sp. 2-GBenrich]PQV43128.1 UDP-glucose 4-epimerase [Methanohalophilus euhalobius]